MLKCICRFFFSRTLHARLQILKSEKIYMKIARLEMPTCRRLRQKKAKKYIISFPFVFSLYNYIVD